MLIKYKDEKTKSNLTDRKFVSRKYNDTIFDKIKNFVEAVTLSDSIYQLRLMHRGMNIRTKKNSTNQYISNLDKKWRLEFIWNENEIEIIVICSVHPHEYNK